MRRFYLTTFFVITLLLAAPGRMAYAQTDDPVAASTQPLSVTTTYPSEVVGIGENVTVNLTLAGGTDAQIVQLNVPDLPDGWTADFKGGSHLVHSVLVQPDQEAKVDLKLALPSTVEPGTYDLTVVAAGDRTEATLPIEMIVQQKLPPSLALTADLPTLRGKPDGTFRYNATLKNEGDEDLNVDLLADPPAGFDVSFKSAGQEVTTLPLEANGSKSLTIEASPLYKVAAGTYQLTVQAQAGEAAATLPLTAEVVGQADLKLATPDGRLSGDVQAGQDTTVNLLLQNNGSAPAEAVSMSSSAPNGWTVDFEPQEIPELAPGTQTEVTAHLQPPEKAIAGDYVVSFRAQPQDSSIQTVDYRATVRTSTLWGIAGIALIALSVAVVGFAVSRFGRR